MDELNHSNTHLNFDITLNTTEFNAETVVVSGSGSGNFTGTFTQHGEPPTINQYFDLIHEPDHPRRRRLSHRFL